MRVKCAENITSLRKARSAYRCYVVKVQGNRSLGSRWHRTDGVIKMHLKKVEWQGVS